MIPREQTKRISTLEKTRTIFDGFVKVEGWKAGMPHETLVIRTTDSVAGLLYDRTNSRVLQVSQQRAAMVRDDNPDGLIIECVAGRFDCDLGPEALLVKEALEEAGVHITEDDVELLNNGKPLALSAGILTERCYLAFAQIEPAMVAEGERFGLAEEGEDITRLWVDAQLFINGTHDDLRVWAFAQFLKTKLSA